MAALSRKNRWLTLDRMSIILGFAFTIIGLLGTQFYIQPAQQRLADVNQQLEKNRLKSHMLTNANALQHIFSQLGALIFALNAHDQPTAIAYDTVAALQVRALDWRHDGTRTYFAALGSAGEIDFPTVTNAYQQLVDKEHADPTSFEAFKNVNSFEGDLVMKSVRDQGEAMMDVIKARPSLWQAMIEANRRAIVSAMVGAMGTAMIFLATMRGERKAPIVPDLTPAEDKVDLAGALQGAHDEVARLLAAINWKSDTDSR